MSNIYITEPPTHGKVLLSTTVGDIEIELFSRECPKACRNFVQLCMENYYDKTKFHRVVKDFIVQGGDPTGTGEGGESIYGGPFKDEFHSRLKFNRRGLLGMANAGKDDNGSQFFFTMAAAPELNNKHTLFGKVVGDTVYNMVKLEEGIIEDERPAHPHKILKTKVLINPFPDIVPRKLIKSEITEDEKKKPKSKMKATKDFKLLSFGEEAEDDETDIKKLEQSKKVKSKSSHDLLNDPKLSKEVGLKTTKELKEDVIDDGNKKQESSADLESIRSKLSKKTTGKDKNVDKRAASPVDDAVDEKLSKEEERAKILSEIKSLKKDLKSGGRGNDTEAEKPEKAGKGKKRHQVDEEEVASNDVLKSFLDEQKMYASKSKFPKKGSSREEMTLAILNKFTSKLRSVPELEVEGGPSEVSGQNDNDDDDEITGDDWMGHKLQFSRDDPILAKDASTKDDDWFDIYDPRNPVNKRRREQSKKSQTKK